MESKTEERRHPKFITVFMLVLDLSGTFLFGIEGALAAIKANLDFFGAMVLAFCTALGGGIIRDLLIGDIPPGSIREWQYGITAFLGGTTAVLLNHFVRTIPPALMITLDAGGLALFAIAGAAKATSFRIHPVIAVLMGTITGVGGGTVRDVFLAQIPGVLRTDIYATAAMLGALIFVTGVKLGLPLRWAAILGGVACFTLRIIAVQHHWNLPNLMSNN